MYTIPHSHFYSSAISAQFQLTKPASSSASHFKREQETNLHATTSADQNTIRMTSFPFHITPRISNSLVNSSAAATYFSGAYLSIAALREAIVASKTENVAALLQGQQFVMPRDGYDSLRLALNLRDKDIRNKMISLILNHTPPKQYASIVVSIVRTGQKNWIEAVLAQLPEEHRQDAITDDALEAACTVRDRGKYGRIVQLLLQYKVENTRISYLSPRIIRLLSSSPGELDLPLIQEIEQLIPRKDHGAYYQLVLKSIVDVDRPNSNSTNALLNQIPKKYRAAAIGHALRKAEERHHAEIVNLFFVYLSE